MQPKTNTIGRSSNAFSKPLHQTEENPKRDEKQGQQPAAYPSRSFTHISLSVAR
jgi:hypothetical protein